MGRRARVSLRPQPTGKKISITDMDDTRLMKLHNYGHLPTPYIHAFTESKHVSLEATRRRLNLIRNEAGLLFEPQQQLETAAFRGNTLVYGLSPKGNEYLKSRGLYSEFAPIIGESQHWIHDFTSSCVCASFELAAPDGYSYEPQTDVLGRYDTLLSFPVKFFEPSPYKKESTIELKPDRVGQINTPSGKNILTFLEVERSKKQHKYRRGYKTTERNGLQYYNFIADREYMEHFHNQDGLGAMVLFVYWDYGTMIGAIEYLKKVVPNGKCKFMLFCYLPNIKNSNFKPLPILKNLWDEPWFRIGYPPVLLTEL